MFNRFQKLSAPIFLASLAACTTAPLATAPAAPAGPEVTLSRLDCGTPVLNAVGQRFSDTYAYGDEKVLFTFSCYLIKHGN